MRRVENAVDRLPALASGEAPRPGVSNCLLRMLSLGTRSTIKPARSNSPTRASSISPTTNASVGFGFSSKFSAARSSCSCMPYAMTEILLPMAILFSEFGNVKTGSAKGTDQSIRLRFDNFRAILGSGGGQRTSRILRHAFWAPTTACGGLP